ncbi:MAG: T9SS type A sorting domain-containing protein [Saprospiraceae bacterium]|nr:T9SS type A sorting domain-containing protein [Saprospiraceae bacterium]
MNKLFFLMVCFVLGSYVQAQVETILRVDHLLAGQPFKLNQEATSPMGTKFKLTRLQYYISGIKITHDGGQVLLLNKLYLFVDPSKPSSKEFILGALNGVSSVEKIEFAVGVDALSNHLDPASYPANHPLAPKNPTMHWGWTSGYRFIAVEGKAARSNGSFLDDIAIHTVGDENFKTKVHDVTSSLESGKLYINMKAEYNQLFDGIILDGGNTNHSESGSAAEICTNASLKVFSPVAPTATKDVYNNARTQALYTADGILIKYSFAAGSNLQFQVFDSNGKLMQTDRIRSNEGILKIPSQILSGTYYYSFLQGNQTLSTGKFSKN